MAQHKAINLVVSIGDKSLSHSCIQSFDLDRNFSDVANKFSMTITDSPKQSTTDLELYMAGGARNISVSYNDTTESGRFLRFTGTIWDYTCSFVGNIKQLTITGYLTKTYKDTAGQALYNIDWNPYYNMRIKSTQPWNAYKMAAFAQGKLRTWEIANSNRENTAKTLFNSNVVYESFRQLYNYNSITVAVKGPGGTIYLPVPDSFREMTVEKTELEKDDGTTVEIASDLEDENDLYWGEMELEPLKYDVDDSSSVLDKTAGLYRVTADNKYNGQIRGFKDKKSGKSYVQLNPDKDYYGAGSFIYSNTGVDPSYIVRQLAILEGWNVAHIAQTEMVECSDKFKMKEQSALEFITNVLIPVSITPVGNYTTKSGKIQTLDKGFGGFVAYFDSNNRFHYEPMDIGTNTKDRTNIKLGYNVPDSPVLSFQVETKGTAFYTSNPVEINSMYLATGQEVKEVNTVAIQQVIDYNKVAGHNEHLDEYFGYTYEYIKEQYEKYPEFNAKGYWIGFKGATAMEYYSDPKYPDENRRSMEDIFKTYESGTIMSRDPSVDDASRYSVIISSDALSNKLVNTYNTSAIEGGHVASTLIANARTKIQNFTLTASLNMWGDTRIFPSSIINLTNMVKSESDNSVRSHPTSGNYLVLKQTDSISGDKFIQKLSLLRQKGDLYRAINPYDIDWSKDPSEDTKTHEAYVNLTNTLPGDAGPTCPAPSSSGYIDSNSKPFEVKPVDPTKPFTGTTYTTQNGVIYTR